MSITSSNTTYGYVPLMTTSTCPVYTSPKLNDDVRVAETILKAFKNEKEKKEMANAKICDICGSIYSTKKYDKIFDDVDDKYDIRLRLYDSNAKYIEICPDCYKALIDKLVERGLEPAEKDDEKDDD